MKEHANGATYHNRYPYSGKIICEELDQIMAQIFTQMICDKDIIINALLSVLQSVPQEVDHNRARQRAEEEMSAINAQKDRLLDLNMDGAISNSEFKTRNDALNTQLRTLEAQLATVQAEEQRQKESALDVGKIRQALEKELGFQEGINSRLVATILDKVIVKKESTKEDIRLDVFLKLGTQFEAVYGPNDASKRINSARNTMRLIAILFIPLLFTSSN